MPLTEYEPLLSRVEKPGRYVGGEMNAIVKDPERLRATIALAFPDVYDLGMSYHGFRLLYERVNARDDFAAERVFAPWPDFADALRAAQLPLTTLETFRPLDQIEIIGFTLQHELCYTNVLEMLDLARIPLHSDERTAPFPLIVAGGEGAYSPEPMAPFIDAFVVGDGEEVIFELLEVAADARRHGADRPELLRRLAAIPGVYVPSLYRADHAPDGAIRSVTPIDPDAAPATVRPRSFDISSDLGATRPVTPIIRTVQNRTVIELRRGCVNGCRFCQAGMITRPARERPVAQVLEIARQSLANTGDDSVSLLSLSTADYSEILPLARALSAELNQRRVSISLPSLRIGSFDVALAKETSSVRKSGFTFAPEAGSERLRRVINKPLDEAKFLDIIAETLAAGWKTIKMYFMIGLPGETDEDLDGIVRIVRGALARAKQERRYGLQLNITLSPFVPKAHTPFQWAGQIPRDEIKRRVNHIRDQIRVKSVSFKLSHLESSVLEGVMARGDRRLGAAIEWAWKNGCRFDAWSETFRPDVWRQAFEARGLDPAWYTERERPDDEIFPYAHIASGPGERFLKKERDRAARGEITEECVDGPCAGCEACAAPKEHRLARDASTDDKPQLPPVRPPKKASVEALMRLRLQFTKAGSLRFISHLDLADLLQRLMRRADFPLAYTQGFNPQPRMTLSPPLPLGFEGRGEIVDLFLRERLDLKECIKKLRSLSPPIGLEWLGARESPLDDPSIQQAVTHFDYHLLWRAQNEEERLLPVDLEELKSALAPFLESDTWPIEIVRKQKPQTRDARAFVLSCEPQGAVAGFDAGLVMRLRSDNGTTLSPLKILEAIFGESPDRGVFMRVARQPIHIPSS